MEHADAVVIGSGFGGLGAALQLAAEGLRVVVCETLTYPGGCAGSFRHRGARFDAGATLGLGVGEGDLFQRIAQRYELPLEVVPLDPAIEIRTPHQTMTVPLAPDGLEQALASVGVDAAPLGRELQATARALRPLLLHPELVPPPTPQALLRHAARFPAYLPLLRQVGRPLRSVLARHGLHDDPAVRALLEPLCWITVQVGVDEAEAPFALGALAEMARGSYHIRGGMGTLARMLVQAIESAGGEVRFATRVKQITPARGGWTVSTRRGELHAPLVFANVLPQALPSLGVQGAAPLARQVAQGWGACMLYLQIDRDALPPDPHHLDLCADPAERYWQGNHVFCSVGAADESIDGLRPVVASTHVPIDASAHDISAVQARMRSTIDALAPTLAAAVRHSFPASPRTFERFTRRSRGLVGGIPRRAGLSQYARLLPRPIRRGLYLVGDSTLLGQSTLAAALSGIRIAALGSGTPIRF